MLKINPDAFLLMMINGFQENFWQHGNGTYKQRKALLNKQGGENHQLCLFFPDQLWLFQLFLKIAINCFQEFFGIKKMLSCRLWKAISFCFY
jgi:hypothetical protein